MKLRNTLIKTFSLVFAVCTAFAIASMPTNAQAETANFSMVQGASIRNEQDSIMGLKFQSTVNAGWLTENNAEKYTFGTLIYPASNNQAFDSEETLENNIENLDAVSITHIENAKITAGTTFNASIVYDEEVIKGVIEQNGLEITDELVEKILFNLYNKDFTARSYAVVGEEVIYTDAYTTSMYKVAIETYELGVKEENEVYKNLALNYFESASVKEAKSFISDGVIVFDEAIQPTFAESAIVIFENNTLKSGVDYSISNQGVITLLNVSANENQTLTYFVIDNGVLTIIRTEFVTASITGIEVDAVSREYKITDNVSNYLTFKFNYDDGTKSDNYALNEGNVYSVNVNGNVATVVVKVTVNNVVYSDEITLTVSDEPSSVAEVLSASVGGEYMLNGVVVGFATTIDQNEVILADNNGNFISVVGIGGGNLVNGSYYVKGIEVGYEITIPVVLKNDGVGANANKLYARYVGGSNVSVSVVSKNNAVSIPNASQVIDSNNDLSLLLLGGNQYKVVTLKGEMSFVMDNDYELYDFWFYDNPATNVDEIAVNGFIPTFSNVSTVITTNKTFGKLALGDENANSLDFNNPHTVIKEITALYLGGNGTHAQFVLLNDSSIKDATPTLTTKELVEPKQLIYVLGDELNFEGSTIIYNYDIRSSVEVEVTEDMVKNMPVIETPGNYTITINDGATDFTFEIRVLASKIKSIEVVNMPTKSTYTHRDSFDILDLSGGKILVTYENGSSEYVDITKEMISLEESDEWKVGTVNYALYYAGTKFILPIVYNNTALSVSQFKSATIGETYDVTGVVVQPVITVGGSYGADFMIKDKETNDVISMLYTGQVKDDLSFVSDCKANIGDEIIVRAKVQKTTSTNGNYGKIWGNPTDRSTFESNLIVVSSNNSTEFDLSKITKTISTQEDLTNLISQKTMPIIVKLVGVRFARASDNYSYLFFDGVTDATGAKYKIGSRNLSIVLDVATTKKYVSYDVIKGCMVDEKSLTASTTTFENYASSETHDFYVMFAGGNSSYLKFVILDESWIVSKTTTQAE